MSSSKPEAVIFDMDGTLANVSQLRHYIVPPLDKPKGWFKDFDSFHSRSVTAPVNVEVKNCAVEAYNKGYKILIVTARRAKYRHHTAWFLALNNIPSHALYMRKNNDSRKDYIVKSEILDQILTRYNPIHAYDDNPAVIDLWQKNSIPTTIVPGWFE